MVLEKNGETLLIDPVELKAKLPALQNVTGIIITHQHNDHFQPEVIARLAEENPAAKIFAPEDMTDQSITAIHNGLHDTAGSFDLHFYGVNHAAVFVGKTPCQNVGVVVDQKIAHPGDMLEMPPAPVEVMFTPISAPWCKVADVEEYLKRVKDEKLNTLDGRMLTVIPVHDAVLSELGLGFSRNCMKAICAGLGFNFAPLNPGEALLL